MQSRFTNVAEATPSPQPEAYLQLQLLQVALDHAQFLRKLRSSCLLGLPMKFLLVESFYSILNASV